MASNRRSPGITVKYEECMRNHAIRAGRYAIDGCGEFVPGGEEGTQLALVCAACGCHRSFHRRDLTYEDEPLQNQFPLSSARRPAVARAMGPTQLMWATRNNVVRHPVSSPLNLPLPAHPSPSNDEHSEILSGEETEEEIKTTKSS